MFLGRKPQPAEIRDLLALLGHSPGSLPFLLLVSSGKVGTQPGYPEVHVCLRGDGIVVSTPGTLLLSSHYYQKTYFQSPVHFSKYWYQVLLQVLVR